MIFLNLTKSATRQHIYNSLLGLMDDNDKSTMDYLVGLADIPDTHHHGVVEVLETIKSQEIPERIKDDMYAVYTILGEAEAHVHGVSFEETHFHEVGNGKSILNALRICTAFHVLREKGEADYIMATPVQTGEGTVDCAHGTMDIPAPATADILITHGIPTEFELLPGELCTPTSAAIIAHFVDAYSVS